MKTREKMKKYFKKNFKLMVEKIFKILLFLLNQLYFEIEWNQRDSNPQPLSL